MKLIVAAALLVAHLMSAVAQEAYPGKKQITLVTPFPAGGGSDILTRILGESLRKNLNQAVVVINVSGAGGTIGARASRQARVDGV